MKVKSIDLKDGLYQVTTPYLCAGFVIEDRTLLWCAPILRKNFHSWVRRAIRIAEGGSIWRTKAEYVYTLERVRPGEYEAALQGKWKPEKKQ